MSSEHTPQQEPAVETPDAVSAPSEAVASSPSASQAQILALQRSAGNAAVSRMLGSQGTAGTPLPPSASAAASLLGPAAGEVRLHRGPDADIRLASRPEALAVT